LLWPPSPEYGMARLKAINYFAWVSNKNGS
jgi:hypothetical protein